MIGNKKKEHGQEPTFFKPKDYYNYLLNEDEIDYIFPSNDKDLFDTFRSNEFKEHWDISYLDDAYWKFVNNLIVHGDDEEFIDDEEDDDILNFNGLISNGNDCDVAHDINHKKDCDIYPIYRVLDKSKLISCKEIITEILPQIYDNGIIDKGYYRMVFATKWKKTGQDIVVKIIKRRNEDLLRSIRESILLSRLYDAEQIYISDKNNNNKLFTQTLNNGKSVKTRGFNYVEEYGHCVMPIWISVQLKYKMSLDQWLTLGHALKSTLSKLIFMSLQIAYSVKLIHTIPGGPYHHTDIEPAQFLLDDNDYVYINDFNRGKFQPYYFGKGTDKIEKCLYCGYESHGHWRSPEEQKIVRPLNEKIDIFSMGLTILVLYTNQYPFEHVDIDDLKYVYYDSKRIPNMTANIPPVIKDVIRSCLSWNPRQRPTATEVVEMFENIYFRNLNTVTQGFYNYTSEQLLKDNTWMETN